LTLAGRKGPHGFIKNPANRILEKCVFGNEPQRIYLGKKRKAKPDD
jgi:hypothetical protein